jgi:hypothetical protein
MDGGEMGVGLWPWYGFAPQGNSNRFLPNASLYVDAF